MEIALKQTRATVEAMAQQDAIAEGVAAKLQERGTRRYSFAELAIGALVAVSSVSGLVLAIAHAIAGGGY